MLLAMKTPAVQLTLNNKPLTLKKTDKIDFRRYNRLRCSVPQPPKLYGLQKIHKLNIPVRPIVFFCGFSPYLSKYLTNVLKPLTDESRYKLQSTEKFIDAIKAIQIPDDHKLVSSDVKSLFTSIPLQLALDCTENAIKNSTTYRRHYTTNRRHYGPTQPLFVFDVLSVQRHTLQTITRYSYGLSIFCCCSRNCHAKHRGTSPSYLHANCTSLVTLR